MKTKIYLLIIVSLVMLVFPLVSFADSTPRIYIDDQVKYEKNKVTLNINMENIESADPIVALRIDLKYDSSKMEFAGAKAGKDLKATLKYDEDFPDENRFSIAAISLNGLENNGLYYTVSFKIKENVNENIPIELSIKEATNSDGKNIKIESSGTTIKLSDDKIENNEETKKLEQTDQTIENFELTNIEPLTSIETIITENGNVEVREEDILSYEVENPDVVELLNDGTMIPNKDGLTKVKLKINGQDVGTATIEVKDGNITKVSGEEKIVEDVYDKKVNIAELEDVYTEEEIKSSLTSSSNNENKITNNTNTVENKTKDNNYFPIIVVIIILLLMFIFIKKIKTRRKK